MAPDVHAARDALRLVTLAEVEDIAPALTFIDELLAEGPAQLALVSLALAHMVSIFVGELAVTGGESRDVVLARMMDGALRKPRST